MLNDWVNNAICFLSTQVNLTSPSWRSHYSCISLLSVLLNSLEVTQSLLRKLVIWRYLTPQSVGTLKLLNFSVSCCLSVRRSSPDALLLSAAGAMVPRWWTSLPNLLDSLPRMASMSTWFFSRSTGLTFFTTMKKIILAGARTCFEVIAGLQAELRWSDRRPLVTQAYKLKQIECRPREGAGEETTELPVHLDSFLTL